jgi:transposase
VKTDAFFLREEHVMMTVLTMTLPPIPVDTKQAALRSYQSRNIYLQIGDRVDQIFTSIELCELDPSRQYSTERLCRLALITAFQFAENLSDGGANRAFHSRLDWMYALHLPLNYPEFQPYTLCAFRHGLLTNLSAQRAFVCLLDNLKEEGLFSHSKYWPSANSEALTVVCNLTRLETIRTSIQASLEVLSATAPEWVRMIMPAHWYKRYERNTNDHPVSCRVSTQQLMAQELGRDMVYLLEAIDRLGNREINQLPEIIKLRDVWHQQFVHQSGQPQWRKESCVPCDAEMSV